MDIWNLPAGFTAAKPIDVSLEQARKMFYSGSCCVQRKRDGQLLYALTNANKEVQLYSAGNHVMTSHLPKTCSYVQALDLPPNTLLVGEFVVKSPKDDDQFLLVGSIMRSLSDRAAGLEASLKTLYYVFDVLYWDGIETWKFPYRDRYQILTQIGLRTGSVRYPVNLAGEVPFEDVLATVARFRWEGLVFWHWDLPTEIKFNGHPARVGCYRWKPVYEDDFVLSGYEMGKGKHTGRVGALYICQYNQAGMLIPYGTVGTGLDDATRAEALNWGYPLVAQIKYGERSPSGTLRFPRFVRLRLDKTCEECVWPR